MDTKNNAPQPLAVTSPAFEEGGIIPVAHTGHGADTSPELRLTGLHPAVQSVAVIMDDLDHPIPAYNHWVVWNLPPDTRISAAFPADTFPEIKGSPTQGVGYGRHRYAGPKPPFNWRHRYRFTVYGLNTRLVLPETTRKRGLLAAMQGHILQQSSLTGWYKKRPGRNGRAGG